MEIIINGIGPGVYEKLVWAIFNLYVTSGFACYIFEWKKWPRWVDFVGGLLAVATLGFLIARLIGAT